MNEEKNRDMISDINYFLKIIKSAKYTLLGINILFLIIGIIISFSYKDEFVSQGKILPEISNKVNNFGQFSNLAALAGVDVGNNSMSEVIRADLYPEVLKSTPFFLDLLKQSFKNKNTNYVKFAEYINSNLLDGKINKKDLELKFPLNKQYLVFNKQTEKSIKELRRRIVCVYDKKSGIITISVKMPDPLIATEVASYSLNYLASYIVKYRTSRLKSDLDYLEERLKNARTKYYSIQSKKATYSDQIPLASLRLQSADLPRERIESEYKISSTFYNSLLQKYEEAKLKLQQETPVIKILEPPFVPNSKNEPLMPIITIFISIIFGLIVSVVFLFLKIKLF
ncbi:MAG: lipopolysaccharide biosynthesis protein [Cytophagaceae bacterium]|nr:lipopolysaccharide biosynthesis protein [Cytophagaceae bacterium]